MGRQLMGRQLMGKGSMGKGLMGKQMGKQWVRGGKLMGKGQEINEQGVDDWWG